jgi:hypothetical protein
MTSKLPRDDSAAPIQALAPDDSTTVSSAITTTSAKVALSTGRVYEISFDTAVYLKVGTTDVTSADTSSRYLPAGSYVYSKSDTDTHVHIRAVSGTGTVTITRLR